MDRRRPGQSAVVSGRQESDQVEILSGVFEERTTGAPIALMVRNQDARSQDYSREKVAQRPGHAADLWQEKFGHSDYRGSGRASGRETVARVMAGAVAEMFVRTQVTDCRVAGWVKQLGPWLADPADIGASAEMWSADRFVARLPNVQLQDQIAAGLVAAKSEGQSYGGVCELRLRGLPKGMGQPVFHKLKADLAAAMLGVGATAGVEFGEGFASATKSGQDFHSSDQSYGGLRGGLSTGNDISLRVAFKPASTLGAMAREGRHDPAIVPRALPVLEAMIWLVVADHLLWQRLDRG